MSDPGEEKAVAALEALYSGPLHERSLARLREIVAFLRANGQVIREVCSAGGAVCDISATTTQLCHHAHVLHEVPSLDGGVTVLDTIALFDTITKRGGVRRVQEQSLWKEVMAELGLPFDRQTLFGVSMHYKTFLYGYEQAMMERRDVSGAQQQQQQPPPPSSRQKQAAILEQARANPQQFEHYQQLLRQQQQQQQQQQLRQQRQLELQQEQQQRQLQAQERQRMMLHQAKRLEEQQQQQRLYQQQQQQQQQQQHQRQLAEQQRMMEQQRQLEQQRQQQQQQQRLRERERQHQQQQQQALLLQQQQQQQQQLQHPLFQSQSNQHHPYNRHGYGSQAGHGSRSRGAPGHGQAVDCIPRAELARALRSTSPREVCTAVNTLTLETYGSSDELILEEVSGLFDAVLDLMDKLNPAVSRVAALANKLRAQKLKGVEPTPALLDAAWATASTMGGMYGCSGTGSPPQVAGAGGELLLAVLNALRNASFVPSNERTIGHSSRAVQHLISLCSANGNDSAAFAASVDLLGRVSKHLDIWGRRAAEIGEGCKSAEDSLSYLAPARVRVVATTSNAVMSASALEYVASAVLLFPTVANMAEAEERIRVLGALGIVSKLAQVETNTEAFNRVPERFLERLVELLAVPLHGCDVLVPQESLVSEEWLEHHSRVMHPTAGGIDAEVRDIALEVMSLLAGLSDKLRSRLGAVPDCIQAVTRVAISGSISGFRVEAQARRMAALTLTALASMESNHARIKPLHPKLLLAAASDAYAADLLFNGLKTVFPASDVEPTSVVVEI